MPEAENYETTPQPISPDRHKTIGALVLGSSIFVAMHHGSEAIGFIGMYVGTIELLKGFRTRQQG